jgi:hypothetical protein
MIPSVRHHIGTSMCACLPASSLLIHHHRFVVRLCRSPLSTAISSTTPTCYLSFPRTSITQNSVPAHHFCGSNPISALDVVPRPPPICSTLSQLHSASLFSLCTQNCALCSLFSLSHRSPPFLCSWFGHTPYPPGDALGRLPQVLPRSKFWPTPIPLPPIACHPSTAVVCVSAAPFTFVPPRLHLGVGVGVC